jgi:hypothetical protein
MKTSKQLPVILAGYFKNKKDESIPYYFIEAKDSNPLLQHYVASQEAYSERPIEKNSVSGMYAYYSNRAKFFGNQGVIELVTLKDGREMWCPDTKLKDRLYAEASSIIDTLVQEGELKGVQAKIELGKLHNQLLKEETGDAYAWPEKSTAVVGSDEDSTEGGIDKF